MLRPVPRDRAREGLTLLELMVVVTIVGVVAALAAPTIGTAMANRRTNELALDVVRLVRNGRSASAGHGVAHMLRIDDDGGTYSLWRGTNDRCNGNDWGAITGATCVAPRCRDFVNFPVVGGSTYTAAITGGVTALCFEPSGRTLWSADDGLEPTFSSVAPTTGGFQVSVTRSVGGATQGVVKLVTIPFGGDARVLR